MMSSFALGLLTLKTLASSPGEPRKMVRIVLYRFKRITRASLTGAGGSYDRNAF